MATRLPPLNSLRAFEVAGRHLSFRKAAEELGVTPAAISQSIKALEDYLGMPLFVRTTRKLRLTEPAEQALSGIRHGFEILHESILRLGTGRGKNILTVSVSPSFGSRWLMPRIERFQAQFPQISVRIEVTNAHANFRHDGVDVALRHGQGVYEERLHSELLIEDAAFPVCSPSLVKRPGSLSDPKAVFKYKLLHGDWSVENHAAPNWQKWLRHAGVGKSDIREGLRVTTDDMLIQAAINGMGMAIATHALVSEDLTAGRLIKPFADQFDMPTEFQHYIVFPKEKSGDRKVQAFRAWAHAEIRMLKSG